MEDENPANPPNALVETDGLLPFDTTSAVCDAQLIAPSGLRPLTLRAGLTTS